MKNTIKYIAILALGIVSCEPEFENPIDERASQSSGAADFSNYVALGNSLTAGFADNSLYIDGQLASYANLLAEQMKFAGGGEFKTPLATSNAGGLTIGGEESINPCTGMNSAPKRTALTLVDGNRVPAPYRGSGAPTEVTSVLQGPFNNMGVSGAKSFHLLAPGYGDAANLAAGLANPYFVRMASSPEKRIIDDAVAQKPTFFTLWIGNNDTLDYATNGGVAPSADNPCAGGGEITDIATFTGAYEGIVQTLLQTTEAKGMLINLPSVTSIPFFTTVPFAPLDPRSETFGPQIPTLNETFAGLNAAFAFLGVPERAINFSTTGPSALVIKDESLEDISAKLIPVLIGGGLDQGTANIFGLQYGQARQATADDLILLTSSSLIGNLNEERLAQLVGLQVPQQTAGQLSINGVTFPMEDRWVLTPAEQKEIADAQEAYNAVIAGLVEANSDRLGLHDAKSALDLVAEKGVTVSGGVVTSQFGTGGGFSLDGVHLTPRGNALVTKGLIEAINEKFGATLPNVEPGLFKTITVQ